MQARQDTILKIKDDAKEVLRKKLQDRNVYKDFLKQLIVQVLIELNKNDLIVIIGIDQINGKRS